MTRREEVEAKIHTFSKWLRDAGSTEAFERRHNDLARTLADEVDGRDRIITELLAMLKPEPKPNYMDPKYNPSKMPALTEYNLDCMWHGMRKQSYARACEIAGRES